MIIIVFNKFISALRDYEYTGWMPEALDKCTSLTILNYLINPVANLRRHIKICERVDNKGVGFTSQKFMDAVLEYAKVPVTIQYYAKTQSYAKSTGTPSKPKDTRRTRCHDAAAATA